MLNIKIADGPTFKMYFSHKHVFNIGQFLVKYNFWMLFTTLQATYTHVAFTHAKALYHLKWILYMQSCLTFGSVFHTCYHSY